MIAAITCESCGYNTADVELITQFNITVANYYTCKQCGTSWMEEVDKKGGV